jgi:Carboxypeptidase regulatory-like domain/TonB dependent receptor-like, beta-barrel
VNRSVYQVRWWPALWSLSALALLVFFANPRLGRSQEVTASITGSVTDPSGAAVAGAKVTAKDTLRGTEYPTQTNAAGVYNLPRLPTSTYSVTVEASGFRTAVRPGIVLQLDQNARVNVALQLGATTQTVEVSGAPPILHTDSMQLSTVITSKINEDLPLATRNYVQLTLLAPGSTNPNPSEFTGPQTTANGGRPYVNGNREQSDNFILDGMDNNQASDNLVGYTPGVDAIQEFNMITNNAPAEFGNFEGAIINATIKSGTDQFHGDAFEFFRNDALNAAQWSDNLTGSPKAKLRWNEFGGTIGGPIKKDKLFFFGDYQGERWDSPATTSPVNVFTNQERAGDFSQVCNTFNSVGMCTNGIQLYNPHDVVNGNRAFVPFNNLAAAGLTIDPVAQKLFASSLYPAPNVAGTLGGLENNYCCNTSRSEVVADQFDVKLDANLSEKDRLSGRFSWSRQNNPGLSSFPLFFPSFATAPTKNTVLDWTRSISPTVVNEARVGFNWVRYNNGWTAGNVGDFATTLGITGGNDRGAGLPAISGWTYASVIGNSNIGTQQNFNDTNIEAEDAIIITHGTHIIHTGFQFIRTRLDSFYAGNNGVTGGLGYTGEFTAGPSDLASANASVGLPEADFWLGLPGSISRGVDTGSWGQRSNMYAAYIQDDWRITDNLTLNLGLRYENHTPWVEVDNRQANFGEITGTEYFAGQSGCPYSNCRAGYNSYNLGYDFQPRFGFAYSPGMFNGKVVVRGSYTDSSYLEGTGTNLRLTLNPPFATEHQTNYQGVPLPGSNTEQGFSVLTTPSDPFAGAVIRLWDPNIQPSLSQQWNLSVEKQFAGQTVLSVGYVGQNATHLMNPMDVTQRLLVGENGCTAANAVVVASDTPTCASPYLSGNPALANISRSTKTESNSDMFYNALQATLQKRFTNGLQYQVAYTYSKCMTNSIGYYGSWGGQTTPTDAYWQNVWNAKAEWAPCESDVTHLLSSYVVYETPFGHGKKYGSSWNGVEDGVLGGWQLSTIFQLRGGFANTVFGADNSGTNDVFSPRPDCISPITYPKSDYAGGGIQWESPSSFASPANGTFGNCGVGVVRGPGLTELDLGIQKEFPIKESTHLEFRAEFINFTNTPILNAPSSFLGGGFGVINSSQGSRNIQFGLKLYY